MRSRWTVSSANGNGCLPSGVLYKLIDDQGHLPGRMITYYGFVSLFPCCCSGELPGLRDDR